MIPNIIKGAISAPPFIVIIPYNTLNLRAKGERHWSLITRKGEHE
jgi:hypothetical protein